MGPTLRLYAESYLRKEAQYSAVSIDTNNSPNAAQAFKLETSVRPSLPRREDFNGSQEAVAIFLDAVERVGPVTIEQLRDIRDGFHPPQVMTVLTTVEAKALRKLAKK
jgi:hypothetical protein